MALHRITMHADRNAGPRIDEDARPAIRVGQDPRSAVQRSETRDTAEPERSPNGYVLDGVRTAMLEATRSDGTTWLACPCGWLTGYRPDALRWHYDHCRQARGLGPPDAPSRAPHPDSETNEAVTRDPA